MPGSAKQVRLERGAAISLALSLALHAGVIAAIAIVLWHRPQVRAPRVSVQSGSGGDGMPLMLSELPIPGALEDPQLPAQPNSFDQPASPRLADELPVTDSQDIGWSGGVVDQRLPTSAFGVGEASAAFESPTGGGQSVPPFVLDRISHKLTIAAGGGGIAPGPPAPLSHNKPPSYPAEARRRGIEGTVVLRIEVLENGTVGEIAALTSSGSDILDRAAIEAVRQWAFEPATLDGKPQRWRGELPIRFVLQG